MSDLITPEARARIEAQLPSYLKEHADRFFQLANQAARDRALTGCSPESILRCIEQAAVRGLEVGSPSRHAAIVPFRGKTATSAILLIQWQGRAFLWFKSGAIRKLKADCVYNGDFFLIESGDRDEIVHRPDVMTDRSPQWLGDLRNVVGSYAIATLASGERVHSFVSRSQLKKTMDFVRSKNAGELGFGWRDWLPEMAKKTAIHRLEGFIQPPSDMQPEQREAWALANNALEVEAEIVSDQEKPDDLPQPAVKVVKDEPPPKETAKKAVPKKAAAPPEDRALTEDEGDKLYDEARTMGLRSSQIKAILRELGCTDMTELRKSSEFDFGQKCAAALKNGNSDEAA